MTSLSRWRADAVERLCKVGVTLDEAQVEISLILEEKAGISRLSQVTDTDKTLSKDQLDLIEGAVKRRAQREPLSHIFERWAFWGLEFKVTSQVLTPRPDTEVLVEEALSWLQSKHGAVKPLVLDVCSGSGCVGLSVLSEVDCELILLELCEQAIAVLEENAQSLFRQGSLKNKPVVRRGDLLAPLTPEERPDLIVSNPPYISDHELKELMPEVRDYEPMLALAGGVDGLEVVRRLTRQAYDVLTLGGALMMEVGWQQTEAVSELLTRSGFTQVRVRADYAGNPRVVIGVRGS